MTTLARKRRLTNVFNLLLNLPLLIAVSYTHLTLPTLSSV